MIWYSHKHSFIVAEFLSACASPINIAWPKNNFYAPCINYSVYQGCKTFSSNAATSKLQVPELWREAKQHKEDPTITCQRKKNLVARATWRPWFAHPCCTIMEQYFALLARAANWDQRAARVAGQNAWQIMTRIKHSLHVIPVLVCGVRDHIPPCAHWASTLVPVRLPYFILCSEYKARSMCFAVRMVSLRMPVFHDVLFFIWFSRLESENLSSLLL